MYPAGQLSEALRSRKTMFLAADHWTSIPCQFSAKTSRELLLDITVYAPGLLERADKIKQLRSIEGDNTEDQGCVDSCNSQNDRCSQAVVYLQDCDSLIRKLDGWLGSLHESKKGPLWWYSEAPALIAKEAPSNPHQPVNLKSGGKAHQSSLIHFSSPRIPVLLLSYWTILLELSTATLEVRNLFGHHPLFATFCEVLGVDSPCMAVGVDMPTKLALRVCQTVMHLSSSLEGCTMAYIPTKLAENHFTRLLSTYQGHCKDDSNRPQNYEMAKIGLQCSKKAFAMVQKTLQNYQ